LDPRPGTKTNVSMHCCLIIIIIIII
jgi:hypothetical protein